MRFYGIPSEERVLEIIEGIKDGVWVLEEDGKTQSFDAEGIKEKLRELVYMVKGWKEQNKYLPRARSFSLLVLQITPRPLRSTTFLLWAVPQSLTQQNGRCIKKSF